MKADPFRLFADEQTPSAHDFCGASLVLAHQARVANHVCGEDRREFPGLAHGPKAPRRRQDKGFFNEIIRKADIQMGPISARAVGQRGSREPTVRESISWNRFVCAVNGLYSVEAIASQ
jgi:hypothetical protein